MKEVFLADHVSAVPNAGFNGTADLDVAHSARGILGFFVIDLLSPKRLTRDEAHQPRAQEDHCPETTAIAHSVYPLVS